MDSDQEKLLRRTLKLAEENNDMLRKVRSVQKRHAFFNTLYWVFIIGAGIGAFYFVQPYIDHAQQFLKDARVTVDKFKGVTTPPQQ